MDSNIKNIEKNESEDDKIKFSIIDALRKVANFLLKYSPLTLLLFSFFGGIWQFFELYSIGTGYLRFFSFSQMISDGILFLIFTTPLFIMVLLTGGGVIKGIKYDEEKINNNIKLLGLFSLFLLSLSFLIFALIIASTSSLQTNNDVDEIIFLFYFGIIPAIVINERTFRILQAKLKLKKWIKDAIVEVVDSFIFIIWIASFLYFLILVFNYIISINNYSVPKNLMNFEKIENKIKEDYKIKSDSYSIEYINDTYIFVEVFKGIKNKNENKTQTEKNKDKKIIIYKIDDLFDSN